MEKNEDINCNIGNEHGDITMCPTDVEITNEMDKFLERHKPIQLTHNLSSLLSMRTIVSVVRILQHGKS